MAQTSVFSSRDYVPSSTRDVIVIAQSVEYFAALSLGDDVCKSAQFTEADVDLVKAAASARLKPSADAGSSVELNILSSTGDLRRVVLGALPTAGARHNTPSRSHSVSDIVKNNKGSADLLIILIPLSGEYAFAQACAAARPFPLFNMKSSAAASSSPVVQVDIVVHLPSSYLDDRVELLEDISCVTDGIRLAQRLVDCPPNILHTDAYVAEALAVAAGLPNCQINVIQGQRLEAEGFGGLWGVGKASEHLPALVILSYVPPGQEGAPSVCMVGKGIVYDTGGLSIKVPPGMAGMKSDMGGSAAVLGAFQALVRAGVGRPVHGLLCIAENSVGPLATRPDDVHTMLSGKTVEVNNTDAEGRLVLADGCFYASKFLNPAYIMDIATLTGAQLIATGKKHAAIYCSHEQLEEMAVAAGKMTGDLTHPIPYCPEFFKPEFRSTVADMKNSVADRGNAQASCAGQFIGNHLETFLSTGGKWLHIDMAGPVTEGDRATGFGVGLLFALTKNLCSLHQAEII